MTDFVMVGISCDSGPIVSYWRTDEKQERAPGGWETSFVFAPLALVEEYETVAARVSEIEAEFNRLEHDLRLRTTGRAPEAQPPTDR